MVCLGEELVELVIEGVTGMCRKILAPVQLRMCKARGITEGMHSPRRGVGRWLKWEGQWRSDETMLRALGLHCRTQIDCGKFSQGEGLSSGGWDRQVGTEEVGCWKVRWSGEEKVTYEGEDGGK